jgi:hypothetical protein
MDRLAIVQGLYYFITGVWPLLSIRTFMAVTGPKTDIWLVKTVGLLITVIGLAVLLAGLHGSVTPEVVHLAVGSAVVLTAVDVIYSAKGIISKIYLVDAVAEIVLIAGWAWLIFSK